jgi:hypothetical protein
MWVISIVLALILADLASTTCPATGPVLPRVLQTEELVKQSSHCVPPQLPALDHRPRIQGLLSLTILVDREGNVACVKLIKGHPLLVGMSLEAARKWTFRPMTQGGRRVSFFGHLIFEFSINATEKPTSCTSAHW